MRLIPPHLLFLLIVGIVTGLFHAPLTAQVRVGEVAEIAIDSPHPYPDGNVDRPAVWSYTLHHPGATFLKVHFSTFVLSGSVENVNPQRDYVVLKDGNGHEFETLSGVADEDFWSRSIPGETVVIELHADEAGNAFGLQIDRYGYGTAALYPQTISPALDIGESICGDDDKTSICNAAVAERTRLADPVGRLLFAGDCGGMFLCTGFLFAPDGRFMTNAHCANSPRESRSMEVWFNYVSDDGGVSCALPERPNPDVFRAKKFLQKECSLDFAVHLLNDRLKGNPADVYGYLPLSARAPTAAEPIWIPQHSEGREKTITEQNAVISAPVVEGVRFCDDRRLCNSSLGQPTGVLSEFGYTADTEPGASGSPVIDEKNQVIGLHHAGNCTAAGGENFGVQMSAILSVLGDPPKAEFTTTPKKRNGRVPFSLTFDGSSSSDSNGRTIFEYMWDFGDGAPPVMSTSPVVSHTYTMKGTYRVFLWVTNDTGRTSEKPATRQIIVRK